MGRGKKGMDIAVPSAMKIERLTDVRERSTLEILSITPFKH